MSERVGASGGRYEIRRLTPADLEAWDAFVLRSPQGHPFALRAWLETAAAAAGLTLEYWAAAKGDQWVAAFAASYRSVAGRSYHVGLPLTPYSPVLYRPRQSGHPASRTHEHLDVTKQLVETLTRRYRAIKLLLPPEIDDVRPWIWAGWEARPRYTYELDLEAGPQPTESLRRYLRKSAEAGFRATTDWDFSMFRQVFDETRERQAFAVEMSASGLERLGTALHGRGAAWMVTALLPDGRPASSQIMLNLPEGAKTYVWLAGTRSDLMSSGVSGWLMFEIAAEARRRGCRTWDLCGADYFGVAQFKAELGPRLEHYFEVDAPRSWIEKGLQQGRRWMRGGGNAAPRAGSRPLAPRPAAPDRGPDA